MDFSLYNIDPQEFRIIDRNEVDGNITYDLEPAYDMGICPTCESDDINKRGTFTRKTRDLSEHAKKVGLIIHTHRYFCNNCHTTFTPTFRSIASRAKMTNRMRDYIQKQSLRVPFSRISDELDVSVPTIKGIFQDYVDILDKKHKLVAPKVIGMDENYLNGQYRCIFTDIENGLILDLLPDRKLDTVQKWLSCLPEKDRIECATMDMWGSYKDAVEIELPWVKVVIDKFHVIKNLNEAFDDIRKSLNDKLTSSQRKHLKHSRFLLLSNGDNLDISKQIFLHDLLESFPQFKEPYRIKEDFRKIYGASSKIEAETLYRKWAERASQIPAYEAFLETVDNWYTEIFNYFDQTYTNAVTESLNAVCKEIAAIGRGYTFGVLRAKILYGTKAAKPAKFHYYEKSKPFMLADTVPSGTFGYMKQTAYSGARRKHIDVSAGTDIRMLEYYLRLGNFWDDNVKL